MRYPPILLSIVLFCIFAANTLTPAHAGQSRSLGLPDNIITGQNAPEGAFPLVAEHTEAPLWHDAADYAGVVRAIGDLQADIERVTGRRPKIASGGKSPSSRPVIIGTIGKSALIDNLIKSGKLDASGIAGKWESFVITTIDKPDAGIEQALIIAGSDKRGTIYGIYELSEQLGVSPWYWWADVPPKKRDTAHVAPGRFASGEPAVKYRGIFINDEEPAFGPWAREKFGGVNSKMYAHMFELILRLRGNYLWPAMWGKSLAEDDPESPRLADEYGVVIGTSHHEPMMRAHADWERRKGTIGNGQWNYATNATALKKFFREGIERTKDFEKIVTIGMRGDGDEPMVEGGDMRANIALLERIVADQRKILADIINPDVTKVPQLWALYKEVADYYESGMKVPDDVTLLWCDDNWGNIRRLPTPGERKRSGGTGIYYHFDYVGSPRCYKWINTNPLPKIWEQMNMAYEYGADRIWIVNVGDLKPMEIPIEFFLRFAWNPRALPKEDIAGFTRRWAAREFGEQHAADIADIVSRYAKYNAWRKPELLEPTTFSLVNYDEAARVLAGWNDIVAKAERINDELPPEMRDAFFQLVLYPTKASATVAGLHIQTGLNHLHAAQGRADVAAHAAQRARELFALDQRLTDTFHALNGGKWNHMMAQTRIGYTGWRDPEKNIMPALASVNRHGAHAHGADSPAETAPGPVAINASDTTRNIASGGVRWEAIPDYGRGPAGMAIFPVTAPSVRPPDNSPRLEYDVLIPNAGDIHVDLITGPTLNVQPGRGVRVAVSFDDQPLRILDAFEGQNFADASQHTDKSAPAIRDWHEWVKDNARTLKSTHRISAPGVRTLKIWMVDPGVVLEKIIIHNGDLRPSYFGPPASESWRNAK